MKESADNAAEKPWRRAFEEGISDCFVESLCQDHQRRDRGSRKNISKISSAIERTTSRHNAGGLRLSGESYQRGLHTDSYNGSDR